MKVLPAFFLSFTLFGSFTAVAHAGHEISHVAQRHAGETSDAEVQPALAAEVEDQDADRPGWHRHGQYRRYGYGPYASDDPETEIKRQSTNQ